ncbi:bifunctional diaminohydroxyphosphoribosylaminopyrimidine deaminase/5-amino-6-(5-phosphoribosylamino)uracil reductase RibD [Xinfangfangia pollutisoli]|uniref:bifunctional diaminohydroxyphosphoribosylaminopyrimidine deaminase/5-amino-6-(5-phosphoribosylamino)uracil reductase RibD n=1 Tax=Xinfangfangia pollutisoli TaxID=2865960 RepID=UPI001CD2FCAD|nr:bifunctional diaminohydroxyphosphoribosylaminopyrimidine deaminase/5-amino-6-(5-phosphoribosylamino)uracil reductase RibD [Xinfangfangia pollutisoli]
MAHALRLAARGNGTTWPNPSVGCVIVKDGQILGRGTTQPGGRPHAERVALAQAGDAAHGATAYVTLEPCAHHGKTSPCAEALVAAGIARVVTALTDPDPRVSGGGHAILRRAGIEVTEGVLTEAATRVTQGFLKRLTRGLPLVTLKLAASLDARTALASGESRWITGPQARAHVHLLRLTHDAVLIGSGTALADDPDLTVRHLGRTGHQPLRIVLDSNLRHSPDSRLGRSAETHPVWILHGPDAPQPRRLAWAETGARLIEVATTPNGHIALPQAFRSLAEEGLTRILAECGATLAAALVAESLVDDLALYSAGLLLGAESRPLLGPLGLDRLADAPRLTLRETQTLGPDQFSLWSF